MANGERRGVWWLPLVLGLAAIGFTVVKGCQEGPFGRHQVVALTPQEESRLGVQAFQEVLSQSDVLRDGPVVQAVREVAQRLAAATDNQRFLQETKQPAQKFEWQVRVVRSKEVNAFCLPGGKIVVYTAILPVAETDAGLATVLGHEISHALAHHGAERMAQQQIAQIGVLSAGASLGDMDPQHRNEVMMALNAGARFGILRYSRRHESEADHMGLLLMAAAGYDPEESVRFWERMQKTSKGGAPPEFLSTHPSHERRIRDLTNWIPEAMPLYKAAPQHTKPQRLPSAGSDRF
jgi:metalloendopeptidase OMA1, mitochondrial